jgi:hypothetical protein
LIVIITRDLTKSQGGGGYHMKSIERERIRDAYYRERYEITFGTEELSLTAFAF